MINSKPKYEETIPDILEFLKLTRTLTTQLQIMQQVDLPKNQRILVSRAAEKLQDAAILYLEGGIKI